MKHRAALLAALQLARFCSVGVVCLVASTCLLAALHELAGVYYLLAFAMSFCVANVLGYMLNGHFTFSIRPTCPGVFRYFLLNGTLLVVNSILMKAMVDGAHMWYIGASLLLAALNAPMSFLLHRSFSYSTQTQPRTSP